MKLMMLMVVTALLAVVVLSGAAVFAAGAVRDQSLVSSALDVYLVAVGTFAVGLLGWYRVNSTGVTQRR
ncbi:hypothetical protein [Streptomyces sp. CB03238]|uniref:hypothetical protein n=1 Tax=Streptomyces sp. CB03238 TaxID=1907777 RepID=UPI000A11907E|nr:hypothetical protein [Streptomyces sp. CB03238]ORT54208.1 hypothetical protein BKD26_36060 [Streptomyces sp. CB03238]